jgi:hypothetical protein
MSPWVDGDLLTPDNLNNKSGGSLAINPTDAVYGAVAGGVVDNAVAIGLALAAAESTGRPIVFPAGTFATSSLSIDFARANISGAGMNQTFIKFLPSANDQKCFHFEPDGAGPLYQCTLKRLSITSDDTTYRKVAICLEDTSEFVLEEVAVGGPVDWTGGSGGSIGLQTKGRDQLTVCNCDIEADRPMVISENPDSGIDCDHYRIEKSIFISTGMTYPCIKFEDGIYISNFSMEDISLNRGLHGVEIGTAAATSSAVFTAKQIRWEQSTVGATGFIVKINTSGFQNVRLEQVSGGSGTNYSGFYFRGVDRLVLDGCDYNGTGLALDVDSTVSNMEHRNCFWLAGSTFSLGNLVEVLAIVDGGEGSTEPGRRTAWFADSGVAGFAVHVRLMNSVREQAISGSLTDDSTVSIAIGTSQVAAASIQVAAAGATQTEGGHWMHSAIGTKKLSGSANTADTDSDTDLCVYSAGGGAVPTLKNRLGETVSYVGKITWKTV